MTDQNAADPKVTDPKVIDPATDPKTIIDPKADPKTADPKTLAAGATATTKEIPATFPADWREQIAGGDDKELNRLKRFASPNDVYKAYLEADKKINSTSVKPVLPKDATPEQLADYRKAAGVPETPDKYDTTLPDGMVIGEADKPVVDGYLAYAHENNIPADIVKQNLAWYFGEYQKGEIARQESDKNFQIESEESIRKEWGADFKANINSIIGLTETMGEETSNLLMFGRTADGKIIGDDPRMLKLLANWAREINPVQTVVPGAGNNAPAMIDTELAELTKLSGDKNSKYWSKDEGPKLQQRMRDLLEAKERMGKKVA